MDPKLPVLARDSAEASTKSRSGFNQYRNRPRSGKPVALSYTDEYELYLQEPLVDPEELPDMDPLR